MTRATRQIMYQLAAKDDNDLLQKLRAGGMQVNEVDKTAFVKASKTVYDEFGKEVKGSQELIDKALSRAK